MTEERPTSAIGKAFAIIEHLVGADEPPQLADISEALGMPKPSVHRMLLQLEEESIVTRDLHGKGYLIGPRLTGMSVAALGQAMRKGTVRDIMRRLVTRLGETCNLGVLDGDQVLYIERVECDQPLRLYLAAGSRVPLHATATGKLLLAYMPPAKREALIDFDRVEIFTPNTLSGDTLRTRLNEIRASGVSVNREESMLGLAGVSVPVRDMHGQVVAGLAVHAPISRFDEKQINEAIAALLEAGREIEAHSRKFGT
jgi:IclR family acetate operon transcriptional repressor